MKKLISFCLVALMMISSFGFTTTFAANDINVSINGIKQQYDVMPVIVDGRTLVPMRGIFEALGAKVGWIDHSKTVTGTRNNKTIKLRINDNLAYIDGQETILDVPATIIEGRTMVPVRFISEMLGESVSWDDDTKTVIIDSDYIKNVAIQPGLKPLTNNIHRNIPREFTSSSNYDDIVYYDNSSAPTIKPLPEKGKIIADMSTFLTSKSKDENIGVMEKATVDGEEVAKITIKQDMSATSKCIFNHPILEGFNEGDTLVVSFDVKLAQKTDIPHIIQLQLQENESGKYKKNIWETFCITDQWKNYTYAVSAMNGYNDFGFRPGLKKAEVLVKNFKITNYESQIKAYEIKSSKMTEEEIKYLLENKIIAPATIPTQEEMDEKYTSKDAEWRKEAFDRIEQHRKGDFKVVVKDKEGNIIPDADVKFSMFESEYKIGTAIDANLQKNTELQNTLNKYFNTVVHEHNLKWGPYVQSSKPAREQLDAAKKAGMKHYRGHSFIWEKPIGSDGKSLLVPDFVMDEDKTVIDDKELFQKYVKEWIYKLSDDFAGEIDEWDVVNEIAEKDVFRKVHGDDIMIDWFKWANEATTDSLMVYNDFAHSYSGQVVGDIYEKMVKYAKYFKENGVDIDTIGFQSHEVYHDKGKYWYDNPEETYNVFKTFTDMGYNTMVTEYSMDTDNEIFQAEYLRDYFIVAFSVPENLGFTFWEFWDGVSYAEHSPMFRKDWSIRPAGEQLIDLMYNKFWTHDTTVKTNSEGVASIRGFYGDYDVTVTHNGVSKTLSCAYHNGYDNVLEFVIE